MLAEEVIFLRESGPYFPTQPGLRFPPGSLTQEESSPYVRTFLASVALCTFNTTSLVVISHHLRVSCFEISRLLCSRPSCLIMLLNSYILSNLVKPSSFSQYFVSVDQQSLDSVTHTRGAKAKICERAEMSIIHSEWTRRK